MWVIVSVPHRSLTSNLSFLVWVRELLLRLRFYDTQFTPASDSEDVEMSWAEFKSDILGQPEIVQAKGSETQYFPGEMKEDAQTKGDSSVYRVFLYCLDADAITEVQYLHLLKTIRDEGLDCVVHSTYSHLEQRKLDGKYRVRVVFPLSRPVLAGEFRLFWSNCRVLFGNIADSTTASPSKHFLVPSRPPGPEAEAAYIFEEFAGKLLDVDEMLTRFRIEAIAECEMESFDLGKERISETMFKELVNRRRKGGESKVTAALKQALGRNSYAHEGAREATLFEIAGILAKEFPRGNPDDLCEPLRFSVEFEEKKGGPKFSDFRDKIIRRQRDTLIRAAQKQLEAAREQARVSGIRDAIDEFNTETLDGYLKKCGGKLKFKDLERSLILVHQHGYYVFTGQGYEYAVSTSLMAVVRDYLLYRAENHLGFSYYFPAEPGRPPQEKTADAFVRDHGQSVSQVSYNYAGASYFDPKSKTLWLSEVESPQRLVPERNEAVEKWMKAFVGGDPVALRRWEQWLAQYANVKEALAGLGLFGPSGIGKSAFAEALAGMFGRNPYCSMKNYVSSFNSEILGNPLVFADESLPEVNGKVPTDMLRTLISAGRHEVNRKNRPIVTLEGFVRTVMAFQTAKKFDFGRGHSREDIDAIGKRFLFILGHAEAAELFDYELFVNQQAIAKHALWLAERLPRSSARFGVETGGGETVIAGDPVAMAVLDWLYEYLVAKAANSAEVKAATKKVAAFVNKERVFVNVTQLRKEWDLYTPVKHRFLITQQVLVEAVRSLSVASTPSRVRLGTGEESFWEIKPSLFKQRVLAMDLTTEERFDWLLKAPHELIFKTKSFAITDEEKRNRMAALKVLGMEDRTA
jgi:hypothetical protein